MKRLLVIVIVLLVWVAFRSSRYNEPYSPSYFPNPNYDFSKNPLNEAKAELGRLFFYDPILSKDSSISCASCHSPFNAFAHSDHELSHGLNDAIGLRNAPALFNLAWQKDFMWDGAATQLDLQALAPITHPDEMGESLEQVLKKLNQSTFYRKAVKQAWGDTLVNSESLLKSLAQFQLSLVSKNAKYDRVKQGLDVFTEQEEKGYKLFQTNCSSCHAEPLFSTYAFANNGLPFDTSLNDYGRINVTQRKKDSLRFKIPSLRNLSYSYPYMHDGRFSKLREVLDHYDQGIIAYTTLSETLQEPISLNEKEKTDLVSFLLTLNDRAFVLNPKHRFPKKLLERNKHKP